MNAKPQVIHLRDGWYAVVQGHLYGPWPMREYAKAGFQVETRRVSAKKTKKQASSVKAKR